MELSSTTCLGGHFGNRLSTEKRHNRGREVAEAKCRKEKRPAQAWAEAPAGG
jgi:hypothetical protein